ncbi:MAG: hypothetical protein LVR00_05550 [Rhabdochlamydiaceae bacterium]
MKKQLPLVEALIWIAGCSLFFYRNFSSYFKDLMLENNTKESTALTTT